MAGSKYRALLYQVTYAWWRGGLRLRRGISTRFYKAVLPHCGKSTAIGWNVYMNPIENISIGESCRIGEGSLISSENEDSRLTLGYNVQIADQCRLDFTGNLLIEDHVLISNNTHIYTHSHGYNPRSEARPTSLHIKSNVWIGAKSIILPNVNIIEEGVIIGAGSIVTKNVPPYAIVAGNPARVISYNQ